MAFGAVARDTQWGRARAKMVFGLFPPQQRVRPSGRVNLQSRARGRNPAYIKLRDWEFFFGWEGALC